MKHKLVPLLLSLSLLLCAACGTADSGSTPTPSTPTGAPEGSGDETAVFLSDEGVKVNGQAASADAADAVYVGADIIYYEEGRDESYGEGTDADAHSAEEAAAHTVVTITQPGTYRISGSLSAGQLAIDLGGDASGDPTAVVTLILDNVDLTCTVAPAVIFYNVYECGSADPETAAPTVDTSAAGANVILADGSINRVDGSYVAKIYKEGTEKKLHKYDGAFYSRMSMNVGGEAAGTGELYITAANEGLDSELHLTINGGKISIQSQDDGINTNEDGVSVTTVNGGSLYISAGLGSEGDGIDSNGYLVMNGGSIVTLANGRSGDGGLDSDMGIYLNGGNVLALGSRNDAASTESGQLYMELSFTSTVAAGTVVSIQAPDGTELLSYTAERDFATATFSTAELKRDVAYAVCLDGVQQQYTGHAFGMGGGMMGGGQPPEDFDPENLPQGTGGERPELPEGAQQGQWPGGDFTPPEGGQAPDGQPGDRGSGGGPGGRQESAGDPSTEFTLTEAVHSFSGISAAE